METQQKITVTIAANITYQGFTYNTKLVLEYKHTGPLYFKKKRHFTDCKEIADRWKAEGIKVVEKPGYYFVDRMAIPNTTNDGKKGIWYINNPGDSYSVNRISKYAKKIDNLLNKEQPPLTHFKL